VLGLDSMMAAPSECEVTSDTLKNEQRKNSQINEIKGCNVRQENQSLKKRHWTGSAYAQMLENPPPQQRIFQSLNKMTSGSTSI
jgi:hypothetical protein